VLVQLFIKNVLVLGWQRRLKMRAFVLILLFASTAHAQDWTPPEAKLRDWGTGRWSTADTARQTGYGVVRLADMAQTRTIAKNPDKWKEVGPVVVALYGNHPSVAEAHKVNLLAFLGVWFVAYQLDPPARAAWQYVHIGAETWVVNENRKLGIKADWPLFGVRFNFF